MHNNRRYDSNVFIYFYFCVKLDELDWLKVKVKLDVFQARNGYIQKVISTIARTLVSNHTNEIWSVILTTIITIDINC